MIGYTMPPLEHDAEPEPARVTRSVKGKRCSPSGLRQPSAMSPYGIYQQMKRDIIAGLIRSVDEIMAELRERKEP